MGGGHSRHESGHLGGISKGDSDQKRNIYMSRISTPGDVSGVPDKQQAVILTGFMVN